MHRPNIDDYRTDIYYKGFYDFGSYEIDLEEYCDELEKKNGYCKDCSHCSLWWKDEYVNKLEGILDKVCKLLDDNDIPYVNKDGIGVRGVSKDQWKEWLLRDE